MSSCGKGCLDKIQHFDLRCLNAVYQSSCLATKVLTSKYLAARRVVVSGRVGQWAEYQQVCYSN